ncbi:hypothetical protein HKX48_009172 [Thoreauomyces humboldtii]|nr:hypothetical protein HKX48_009172 [Thoreauomyces humboldtii]
MQPGGPYEAYLVQPAIMAANPGMDIVQLHELSAVKLRPICFTTLGDAVDPGLLHPSNGPRGRDDRRWGQGKLSTPGHVVFKSGPAAMEVLEVMGTADMYITPGDHVLVRFIKESATLTADSMGARWRNKRAITNLTAIEKGLPPLERSTTYIPALP